MILLIINSYSLIILSLISTTVLSSEGTFEIHIKNYLLFQPLNLEKCCPSVSMSSTDCASQCKIFMEICLSVYQKVPHRYACDIGENMIVTDVLGNEQMSQAGHRDYSIKVRERWMKNFNILVRIKHRNEKTKKDELIVTLSSAEENVKPSSDWITKQLSNPKDHFQLLVSFRYSCSKYHYGDMCDKYCKPNKGVIGNYNCSTRGEIICHDGYNGTYCDKVVCQNKCIHGTCIGPNICRCFTGWSGESCDKCVPYPGCVNGACRRDEKTNELLLLTCDCKKGWGGMFCNIDLNYCSKNPNVCLNEGECQNFGNINTNQQYRCICKPGFSGTHCEKAVVNCLVRGCLNDGLCQINVDRNISKCSCKDSFYGDRCQFNMTSCVEGPCVGSNSKCHPDPDSGFRCDCATGFIGRNCEIDKDECSVNPCLNGGMCIDRASGFRCVCPVGFSGHRCQVNKNDCQRLSCMNGAKCMDKANRIDCECTSGWTGSMCNQNINECAVNQPCVNDGRCEDTPGSYKCICKKPWSGIHCQIKASDNNTDNNKKSCFINPCRNNGICFLTMKDYEKNDLLESIGGPYYCVCRPGFTGRLCKQIIIATGSVSNTDSDLNSTPFVFITSKNKKNYMTLINLIIISIGVPAIVIITLVVALIWCKTSKKFQKSPTTIKYQNNVMKNHNFSNNANIQILNNKLDQNDGNIFNKDKIPLSVKKLENQLSNKDIKKCSYNMRQQHLPLYTYSCSGNLSHLDHRSAIISNPKLFSLKSMDIDEEEDQFTDKSFSLVNDRDGEPESIYQNSNLKKEFDNSNPKSIFDEKLKNLDNSISEPAISSNISMTKRNRNIYEEHGMCSSQNSLLEAPMDHNLRYVISQQFHKPSTSMSFEDNYCDTAHQINTQNLRSLHNHNDNLELSLPTVNYSLPHETYVDINDKTIFTDNKYVLYYTRTRLPSKINYDLISHPNFKETSCFLGSSVIRPSSLCSVQAGSTIIDDSASLNL